MASNKSYHEDEALMTSLTGILWKCSKTDLAVKQLEKLVAVPVFTQLLESPSLQVFMEFFVLNANLLVIFQILLFV